jgi:iron complex transport system substrate-binding protein
VPRIVSLISSATEIVHALGQIDCLVGRSHECDYPEQVLALPVCTRPRIAIDAPSAEIDRQVKASARTSVSIYDVFDDVIERLAPTHILTQVQCEVCAVSLRDVEAALARGMKGHPLVVSLQPDSLDGIWRDMRRVGEALGVSADPAVERCTSAIQALAERAAAAPHPGVACIEWIDPLMAAGNWMPELIPIAGGVSLFGEAGRHSPWMSWEQLAAADPEVIVVAPCGFELPRSEREIGALTAHPGWNDLRAVRGGRVYLADGNRHFNRPGPRIVETLEILCEILHPEIFPPRFRGSGWRPL